MIVLCILLIQDSTATATQRFCLLFLSPIELRMKPPSDFTRYASKIMAAQQQTSAAKDANVLLTFCSMNTLAKNAQQRAAFTAMLDECVELVAVLARTNSIVLPGSRNDANMDFGHPLFSIQNLRGHV